MQLSLTIPTSAVVGKSFTILMNGTTGAVGLAPTGTLTLYDGATSILSLSGNIGGWGGTGSGTGPQATAGFGLDTGITLSTLGDHSLVLKYSGDTNYAAAATSPQTVRVVYPTTMTLQSNATTVNYGSSITLSATLNTTQASPPVTGQITFASSSGQQTIATGPMGLSPYKQAPRS
jgi:hypothetical protein